MKLAFLGVRLPGHLNPMTTLARKLKARGHDVVFYGELLNRLQIAADRALGVVAPLEFFQHLFA
jgi:UDP:flavonoid glycosyltransferase YjiC (YdhE family)